MKGKIFALKVEYLLYILETYNHRLKDLSTYSLAIYQKNELKESSKVFFYLTTLCQPSLVNFQQSIEKTREVKRGQL